MNEKRPSPPHASLRYTAHLALLAGLLLPAGSPARQDGQPYSQREEATLAGVPLLSLEAIDTEAALKRDTLTGKPGVLQIAEPRAVSLTPDSDGVWEQLAGGDWLWRLRVEVPGATDLSFGFTRYSLPEGATLHLWAEGTDYYEGPYSARDNKRSRELWTPVVPGERAVVELFVPQGKRSRVDLRLTRVAAGYRDMFGGLKLGPQGTCNNDVVCPEGDDWRDPIRSVGRYSIAGLTLCSGFLVNNNAADETPYFLSAFHCGINNSNDQTLVFYWNYHSPQCGQHSGGSLADNQTGAKYIAGKANSDVAMVKLDEAPDGRYGVYYAGFDRSGETPNRAVGIHHPSGGEKSISFENNALNKCGSQGLPNHWRVIWDDGTTEPGSSGSPLFDNKNQRAIGTLTSGNASCGLPDGFDCYGSLQQFLKQTKKARTKLGIKKKQPKVVDGLDSSCDCDDPSAIVGGPDNDVLSGTPNDDILCGLGGNDTLKGKGGRDCLEGGEGDDKLLGGKGADALHGGEGDDVCKGGKGKDNAGGCETTTKVP